MALFKNPDEKRCETGQVCQWNTKRIAVPVVLAFVFILVATTVALIYSLGARSTITGARGSQFVQRKRHASTGSEETAALPSRAVQTQSTSLSTANGCSAIVDEPGRMISYRFYEPQSFYPASTEAHFTCVRGKRILGESVVQCHSNEWSGDGYCANNIALQKRAWQSSTAHSGFATRAVDGDTTHLYDDQSCTHTRTSTNPWLIVDLAGTFRIQLISIYNRRDCCAERLFGAKLIVKNGRNETVVATVGEEVRTNPSDYSVDMVVGTQVKVYLEGHDKILTVCELEVYGNPV